MPALDWPDVAASPTTEVEERPVRPRSAGHVPALDAVRGLAILLVTLYRFRQGPDDTSPLGSVLFPMLDFGARGVDLFFVLSGFLITGILYDSKFDRHYFRNFYARRALRIFPLYYGVLGVAFFVLPWLYHGPSLFGQAESLQGWLWLYGSNLLIAVRAEWCLGRFDHFWSLAVEEHFYLVWPLVIYYCSRRTAARISLAVALASAAARIGWAACSPNGIAADVFTLFRLDALLIGAWIALAARGPGGLKPLVPAAKCTLIVAGLLLLATILSHHRLLTVPTTLFALFFGAFLVLTVTAQPASWLERLGRSRGLQFLGKYSYGMYVFQNLLIPLAAAFVTAESLTRAAGSPLWGRLSYIAVMSCLTVLAAFLSWHLFEKHFLRWKDHFTAESVS